MVQRGDFTVAIACVPCGPRRSLIYAWAWGICGCWKLSAAEQVKSDCCLTPAVVSIFWPTPLPGSLSCSTSLPHHYKCFMLNYDHVGRMAEGCPRASVCVLGGEGGGARPSVSERNSSWTLCLYLLVYNIVLVSQCTVPYLSVHYPTTFISWDFLNAWKDYQNQNKVNLWYLLVQDT